MVYGSSSRESCHRCGRQEIHAGCAFRKPEAMPLSPCTAKASTIKPRLQITHHTHEDCTRVRARNVEQQLFTDNGEN